MSVVRGQRLSCLRLLSETLVSIVLSSCVCCQRLSCLLSEALMSVVRGSCVCCQSLLCLSLEALVSCQLRSSRVSCQRLSCRHKLSCLVRGSCVLSGSRVLSEALVSAVIRGWSSCWPEVGYLRPLTDRSPCLPLPLPSIRLPRYFCNSGGI